MSLDAIPIHVINAPSGEPGLTGNAPPLLRELLELAQRLLDTGEPSSIDLTALPLTPADLDWLREKLGAGEIAVTLQANGESTLDETACPGVWWVTHVAYVPELVKADPQDIKIGQEYLELLLSDL